jgi:hypothetical protein
VWWPCFEAADCRSKEDARAPCCCYTGFLSLVVDGYCAAELDFRHSASQRKGRAQFILFAAAETVEKEGAMAIRKSKGKTRRISLRPIVDEIESTKGQLLKAKKVSLIAGDQKAIESRIKALDQSAKILAASCAITGVTKAPPLSIIVKGK